MKKYIVKNVPVSGTACIIVKANNPEEALHKVTEGEGKAVTFKETSRDPFKIIKDEMKEFGVEFITRTTVQEYE